MQEIFCTSDTAKFLDVSPDAVRLYERSGKLPAIRTVGGVRLFDRRDVEKFAAARKTKKA